MRALGIDLGSKRIGVAVSDTTGTIASPLCVVDRSRSRQHDHRQLAAIVAEHDVEIVVVGLPLSLDGSLGPAARRAVNEARLLANVVDVPVETSDERFTTVTADRSLREGGVRGEDRRRLVDKVAAAILLQSWLDARRNEAAG
jgi:putative Holliday junction resolvase